MGAAGLPLDHAARAQAPVTRPDDGAHLCALLAPLAAPYALMAGNHDERMALRAAAFPAQPWAHPLLLQQQRETDADGSPGNAATIQ